MLTSSPDDIHLREARANAVEELCDGFAHDSRNPLHAMVIHLEVLADKLAREKGEVPSHMQKNLKSIRDQVDRLDDQIRQFVTIAAPRRQSTPDFDGPALVKSVLNLCTHRARILRADLKGDLEEGIRITGNASELAVALTLAVRDLLEAGGRHLRVHLRRVDGGVALELEGGSAGPGTGPYQAFASLQPSMGGRIEVLPGGIMITWPQPAGVEAPSAVGIPQPRQERLG